MAVASALVAGALSASQEGAAAQSAGSLPGASFSDLLVDQAHARVYVSGGSVAVANLAGTVTGTVEGISSARQMTLTPDGNQLIVADGDGLTVVDAATATVVRTISTGANSCPDAVAPASGLIFYSYGDCSGGTPGVGAVDLATDEVDTGITTGTLTPVGVQMTSVPATPNVLAVIFDGGLAVLDASGAPTPSLSVRTSIPASAIPIRDLALTPDGSKVVTAGPENTLHRLYSTVDLAEIRAYSNGGNSAKATAVRADGLIATGHLPEAGREVTTYRPTSGAEYGMIYVLPTGTELVPRGLAFGTWRLYMVGRTAAGTYVLVSTPPGPAAKISVTADHTVYHYRKYARLTVSMPTPTLSRKVKLYFQPAGGTSRLIRTGYVDPVSRKVQFSVQVTQNSTFRAVFDGDDAYQKGDGSRTVRVRSKVVLTSSSTSMSGAYHRLKASPAPIITGTVYPFSPKTCVRVWGGLYVGEQRLVEIGSNDCLRTTSNSRFAISLNGFERGDRIKIWARANATSKNLESPPVTYYVLIT